MNSGACLEPTFLDSEPKRHLTVEELQPDLNKLCAEEAESEQSDSDIDSPSAVNCRAIQTLPSLRDSSGCMQKGHILLFYVRPV